jgi:hypothetical protein
LPIDPSELNDDLFGRLLDRIHESGCENLFYELALTVRIAFFLPGNYDLHSDTTSHILYGNYPEKEGDEPPALQITYDYLKEKKKGFETDNDRNGHGW